MAETEEKLESIPANGEESAVLADGNTASEPADPTGASENCETSADPAPPPDGAKASQEATQPEGEEAQESKDVAQNPEDAAQSPAPDGGCEAKMLVDSAVQRILEAFAGLKESFDGKLRYDAKKDAIIDRQAGELEEFKKGLIEKSTLSFAQDLISEVDSAEKLSRYYETAEFSEENYRKLRKALKDSALSLCDILEKYGVLTYRTEPGKPFNSRRQRARLTTKTGDAALDKTVKTLLGAGFEQEREDGTGTKVLRPELVDVYVFDPALAPPPAAEAETTEKPEDEPTQPAAADVPPPQEPLS